MHRVTYRGEVENRVLPWLFRLGSQTRTVVVAPPTRPPLAQSGKLSPQAGSALADGVFGPANREATTSRLTTDEPMGGERAEKKEIART